MYADGHIAVYGEKHVAVKIINRPVARSNEAGITVDALIDSVLPYRFKEIYYPSAVRGRGNQRRLEVGDIADKIHEIKVHNAIKPDKPVMVHHKDAIMKIMEA